ncbi:hypothetical protein [Streptomyces sp. NK08203]|uniref:hypothetical protein n=1 Tax=Streptomyces sp. NK08203 TaxID=2821730 RepID=UPI0020C51224|nr:hypothetical protein [Streptomyces sp. NK08203]
MSAVRAVTMGPAPATPPGSPRMSTHPRPAPVDVYDLTEELLLGGTVKGLTISGNADQIHLQRQAPLLEEFGAADASSSTATSSAPSSPASPRGAPSTTAARPTWSSPPSPRTPSSRASTRPNSSTARASRAPPPARS